MKLKYSPPLMAAIKALTGLSSGELSILGQEISNKTALDRQAKSEANRSNKGTRIDDAFFAVPEAPVLAEVFCEKHNVSVNTMKQCKRFDRTGLDKPVWVRQPRAHAERYIWRGDKDLLKRMIAEGNLL